jgi:cyclase
VTRRLPDVTTSSGLTVHVGGRRVELPHPGGPAHTTGDLIAWLGGPMSTNV